MRMFKKDLFGFADIVGIHAEQIGTTYFQVTAGMNNKAPRLEKIEAQPATRAILKTGNTIEVHVWRKLGKRGGVKRWTVDRSQARLHGDSISWITVFEKEDDEFEQQQGLQFDKAREESPTFAKVFPRRQSA
jgi:hypothetical protein